LGIAEIAGRLYCGMQMSTCQKVLINCAEQRAMWILVKAALYLSIGGCCCHLLELLTFMSVLAQAAHGALQGLPSHALASASLANNHVAMPGHFAVKDLDDLGHKLWNNLHNMD